MTQFRGILVVIGRAARPITTILPQVRKSYRVWLPSLLLV